ncbi:MAG: thiamine-monophosphate kinase [Verrucomicrobiales bacterium]|nr:thiamine-monophosphate kinase [Verrucomicrobiales bacterium]
MKTVAQLGEDALIARLVQDAPLQSSVILGPGDDCAVVQGPSAGRCLLLKTDVVVEGAHFTAETAPEWVGRKALARVLSDVAAMGGTPEHATVTLLLPGETAVSWAEAAYAGLHELARQHGVSVVGGETAWSPLRILSVHLTGSVAEAAWARRDAARMGDGIWVTGRLGGSLAGHHLTFSPRLEQGRWLVAEAGVRAMMDLSDGLARDLPRLARASGVGFEVDWDQLPCQPGCNRDQAWGDGEDYELLFTLPASGENDLLANWQRRFSEIPLTRIGRITAPGQGETRPTGGWDAFDAGQKPSGQVGG